MSELHRNSDLVECGVDEFDRSPKAPKKKKKAEEAAEVAPE